MRVFLNNVQGMNDSTKFHNVLKEVRRYDINVQGMKNSTKLHNIIREARKYDISHARNQIVKVKVEC